MLTTLMTRRDLLLAAAAAVTLKQGKLDEAFSKLEAAAQSGAAEGSVLLVQQGDSATVKAFGTARDRKPVFLLASISKPMTATGVMVLADRGELKLTDPVQRYIPEFRGNGREEVLIRHLLTHTSGLPDMLPENGELRKRHAPLKDFVAGTCRTPLLFKPGSQVRYQSMGILLACEIATRITKQPFSDFLRDQLFKPLQMKDTSLGLGGRPIASTMHCQVDQVTDWDWNSVVLEKPRHPVGRRARDGRRCRKVRPLLRESATSEGPAPGNSSRHDHEPDGRAPPVIRSRLEARLSLTMGSQRLDRNSLLA